MSSQLNRNILTSYLTILIVLFAGSSVSEAQSVSDLEKVLDQLQREKAQQEVVLNNLLHELSELPDQIVEAEAELQIAEQQLVENQQELQNLESMSRNGEDVSRDVRLQSHAIKMAARRVESRSRSLSRIRANLDALQLEINSAEAKIKTAELQITQHQQRAAKKKVEHEIQRNVAEQRKASPPPQLPPTPAAVKPGLVKPGIVKPVIDEKPAVSFAKNDTDALASAREYLERLGEYQANKRTASAKYDNLKLSGSKVRGNPTFEHIAFNQYRTEAHLGAGLQSLEIGNRTFRMTGSGVQFIETDSHTFQIEVTEAAEYVVYVDGKDPAQMQLVFFKKSLLNQM